MEASKVVNEHLRNFVRSSYVQEVDLPQPEGEIIDCSLGTNPFGCPATVMDQLFAGTTLTNYPEPFGLNLRQAISTSWQRFSSITPGNIFLGTGSMGVLERLNKLFLRPGKKVLGYCPQFTEYITEVRASGAQYDYVPLDPARNLRFYRAEFLETMTDDYNLFYLDNPNNPTGQIIPLADLEAIVAAALDFNTPIVIDEAYGDFMEPENSAISLVSTYPNLVVVRSFSKGYGLAGLRVGYGVMGEELAHYFKCVDLPFSVTTPGLKIGLTVLQDENFLPWCRTQVAELKAAVTETCRNFLVATTDPTVPIMVLGWPDPGVNLFRTLYRHGVVTEAGDDFLALGSNYVRLRIPPEIKPLQQRLEKVADELASK